MNSEQFIKDALRTESKPETLNFSRRGLHLLLGASLQMAKIVDTAKKTMFYGKTLDEAQFCGALAKLREELIRIEQGVHSLAIPGPQDATLTAPNMRIAHGAIGMFGEAGELLEAVMKHMETGKLDMINVAEETGDSDWYKAIIHDETGISEETCRAKVVAKLKSRYGEKFSNEAALNRDLVKERKVLEKTKVTPAAEFTGYAIQEQST